MDTSPDPTYSPNPDASSPESYTILRIKRKRTDEPLDALVVESRVRRKKSRPSAVGGGGGVFQFAQTVEADAWADARRRQVLQDEITRLAKAASSPTASPAKSAPASAPTSTLPTAPPSPTTTRQENRRYKIIKHDSDSDEGSDDERGRKVPDSSSREQKLYAPPTVLSARALAQHQQQLQQRKKKAFRMYDVEQERVEEEEEGGEGDDEMDKFMPMLRDYLKLHDIPAPAPPSKTTPAPPATKAPPVKTDATKTQGNGSDDEYVWDVFYHRPAQDATSWGDGVGAGMGNVATLTGLPPSLTDPYGSDSDEEEEDEADEDSNAEEYFTNDYPDEEESDASEGSSDEFHEHSENESVVHDWR
ncbi:hypothetical protein PLICRDRAFT_43215 [Plicaturopsis crispa FD-325 SS-3]|nr:hypothetical protein PLICRDRAFT_43215 [Plicaturopsis crispa FD-325 SS-3]